MEDEHQKDISRVKAVRASVEWWELYVCEDGKCVGREDGVSDGTQFWCLDDVEIHVKRVLDFHDRDMVLEKDPDDSNVTWIHAIARRDKDENVYRSRKAVRIRRYLDADELQLLIEDKLGESPETVKYTLEIEDVEPAVDTQHAAKKQKTSDSE